MHDVARGERGAARLGEFKGEELLVRDTGVFSVMFLNMKISKRERYSIVEVHSRRESDSLRYGRAVCFNQDFVSPKEHNRFPCKEICCCKARFMAAVQLQQEGAI